MTAKVLIVDDIDFNVKLLETKLKQEYYQTFTAFDGRQAIETAKQVDPDIILMDIMMPIMNGFDATKEIKNDPELSHIPIIMVTALNAQEDRVKGLEMGADDFLTKPINDHALMSRLKSLVRLKTMNDELKLRDKNQQLSPENAMELMQKRNQYEGKNVLIVEDDVIQSKKMVDKLTANKINADVADKMDKILALGKEKEYHAVLISTLLVNDDGLALGAELRSNENFRNTPILIIVDESDDYTLSKGLEMGVNDYLISPLDVDELLARAITQIRRKNYQNELKDNLDSVVTQSQRDSLTGLYNRNYLDIHFKDMVGKAVADNKSLSIIMIDIDNFKNINDTHGHPSGDAILKEVGRRLEFSLRTSDFCARYGGEEFLVVLPDTTVNSSKFVAERLRMIIEDLDFEIPAAAKSIGCTISLGVTGLKADDTPETLIARADSALYKSKESGKNKFTIEQ